MHLREIKPHLRQLVDHVGGSRRRGGGRRGRCAVGPHIREWNIRLPDIGQNKRHDHIING